MISVRHPRAARSKHYSDIFMLFAKYWGDILVQSINMKFLNQTLSSEIEMGKLGEKLEKSG